MYKLAAELELLFIEKSIRCELYYVRRTEIAYEITWGDWKHSHMNFDHVVKTFLNEKGINHSIDEILTDEDGGDCYSAVHIIHFT